MGENGEPEPADAIYTPSLVFVIRIIIQPSTYCTRLKFMTSYGSDPGGIASMISIRQRLELRQT